MKIPVVCLSNDPYEKMHDHVNADSFDYFEEGSETKVTHDKLLKLLDDHKLEGFADYRMFVVNTDFPSYDDFREFVLRRVRKQESPEVKMCLYDVHVSLL